MSGGGLILLPRILSYLCWWMGNESASQWQMSYNCESKGQIYVQQQPLAQLLINVDLLNVRLTCFHSLQGPDLKYFWVDDPERSAKTITRIFANCVVKADVTHGIRLYERAMKAGHPLKGTSLFLGSGINKLSDSPQFCNEVYCASMKQAFVAAKMPWFS